MHRIGLIYEAVTYPGKGLRVSCSEVLDGLTKCSRLYGTCRIASRNDNAQANLSSFESACSGNFGTTLGMAVLVRSSR